ncbi:MAG: UDP-N-acetylglucosamine--N-acetylmuramyl-(pentapeptide) pyrophosphoryl-undecaprenol N-acetylglucosamine transferase [Candidatus Levyibacteriota bacterium]|nr:MAG: UDP-N-acetylglucosamine--N-acetylmuramyl-(pentapeptide) pyrophosphoryl-undecaprenol N-acetylglucosamine transferase [Candidatus Levybacteria bacterium]
MKILITGGGHFSPAMAVIESLPKGISVLMVGRKYSFEGDNALSIEYIVCQERGIPFIALSTGRLQRKFTKYTISSLLKIPFGFFKAQKIMRDFKPDVVLSFGGYISLPVVLAAYAFRTPIVVHEQTLEAGMANKIASYFTKKVCISWESSRKFFPKKKVVLTGNPIRRFKIKDLRLKIKDDEKLPIIYVTGGSSGSHAINLLVEGCIEGLLENFIVFHQTGDAKEFNDFERLNTFKKTLKSSLQKRYILEKFVPMQNVGEVINRADLIISRSGINTITELLFFGKPAILIPITFSQRNEQLKNATFLQEHGLAKVLEQETTTSETLYQEILEMLKQKNEYMKSAKEAKKLVIPDARERILAVLQQVVKK